MRLAVSSMYVDSPGVMLVNCVAYSRDGHKIGEGLPRAASYLLPPCVLQYIRAIGKEIVPAFTHGILLRFWGKFRLLRGAQTLPPSKD